MKFIIAILLVLNIGAAVAMPEVECQGYDRETKLKFVVDSFPSGSWNKPAYVSMNLGGTEGRWNLNVDRYFRGFNRLNYIGGNVDVEVDLWPDQVPRWGRIYYGTFRNDTVMERMSCRFPTAH